MIDLDEGLFVFGYRKAWLKEPRKIKDENDLLIAFAKVSAMASEFSEKFREKIAFEGFQNITSYSEYACLSAKEAAYGDALSIRKQALFDEIFTRFHFNELPDSVIIKLSKYFNSSLPEAGFNSTGVEGSLVALLTWFEGQVSIYQEQSSTFVVMLISKLNAVHSLYSPKIRH